jgi:hypothetical protein
MQITQDTKKKASTYANKYAKNIQRIRARSLTLGPRKHSFFDFKRRPATVRGARTVANLNCFFPDRLGTQLVDPDHCMRWLGRWGSDQVSLGWQLAWAGWPSPRAAGLWTWIRAESESAWAANDELWAQP